jgi:prevent-host-death family protein
MRELNQQTASVMARVERGETFEITNRGKVIGRIVPPSPGGELDDLIAAGRVVPAIDPTPFRMPPGEVEDNAVSEALVAMREEERW